MKMFKTKEIDSALTKKGFIKTSGGNHNKYIFYYNGKPTKAFTILSRGENDPGKDNLSKIKKQLFFDDQNDFSDFIDCPFTEDMYIKYLKSKGKI